MRGWTIAMQLHYLEVVTPDVDGYCATHQSQTGAKFGDPEELLGNARVADLASGGRIGVRAPMHDAEEPAVRPYVLVDDVAAATGEAEASGGQLMVPPMELPGLGTFSIVDMGGIQQGFWQV